MRREFHAHAPEGIVNAFVTRGGVTCDPPPLHPPGLRVKLDLDSSKNQAASNKSHTSLVKVGNMSWERGARRP